MYGFNCIWQAFKVFKFIFYNHVVSSALKMETVLISVVSVNALKIREGSLFKICLR